MGTESHTPSSGLQDSVPGRAQRQSRANVQDEQRKSPTLLAAHHIGMSGSSSNELSGKSCTRIFRLLQETIPRCSMSQEMRRNLSWSIVGFVRSGARFVQRRIVLSAAREGNDIHRIRQRTTTPPSEQQHGGDYSYSEAHATFPPSTDICLFACFTALADFLHALHNLYTREAGSSDLICTAHTIACKHGTLSSEQGNMTDHRDESSMPEEVGLGTRMEGENVLESIQPETTASEQAADATEQPIENSTGAGIAESSNAVEQGEANESEPTADDGSDGNVEMDSQSMNAVTEAEGDMNTLKSAADDSADKDVDWNRIEVKPATLDTVEDDDDNFGNSQIVDQRLTSDCISVPPSDDETKPVPQSHFSDSSSDEEDDGTNVTDADDEDDVAEDADATDESLALTRMHSNVESGNVAGDLITLNTYDPIPEPAPLIPEYYDPQGFLQTGPVDYEQPVYKDQHQAERMRAMNLHFRTRGPMARVHGVEGKEYEGELYFSGLPFHKPGKRKAYHVRERKDDLRDLKKRKPSPLRTSGRLTPSPETSPEAKMGGSGQGFSAEAAERAVGSSGMKWSDFADEDDEAWVQEYTEAEISRRASEAGLAKDTKVSSSPDATLGEATQPDTSEALEVAPDSNEATLNVGLPDALTEDQVFGTSRAAELARPPTRGKGEDRTEGTEEHMQARQEQPKELERSPLSPEFFTGEELYTGLNAQEGYAYYKKRQRRQPEYNAKPGVYNTLRKELQSPISYLDFDRSGTASPLEDDLQLSQEAQASKQQAQVRDKIEAERALLSQRVQFMQQLTVRLNDLRNRDPRELSNRAYEEMDKIQGARDTMKDKDAIMLEIFKLQMLRYRYSRFIYRKQREEYREQRNRYRDERNEAREMYKSVNRLMDEKGLEGVPEKVQHLEKVIKDLDAYSRGAEASLEEEKSRTKQAKQELRLMMQRHEEATEQLQGFVPLIDELEMERKFHEKAMQRAKVAEWKLQRAEEAQEEIVAGVYEQREKAMNELKAEGEKAMQELKERATDAAAKLVQEVAELQAELGKCRQQVLDLESENDRLVKDLATADTESQHAEVEQLQNEIEGLHDTVESLRSNLAAQRETNDELTTHQKKSVKHSEGLQVDLDSALEQLTVADNRIEGLEAELEQAKITEAESEDMSQRVAEREDAYAASPVRSLKRLPAKPVRAFRPAPIHTDSDEILPQALPTTDISRTPHHAPLRTPILPGRPQAWVEREVRLMQSETYLANVERRRQLREAREQVEKQRMEEVRKALAASCEWEEMPYVPKVQRWAHLVA